MSRSLVQCFFLSLIALPVLAQDVVTKRAGNSERGTIIAITREGVTVSAGGVETQVATPDIVRITFADEPDEMGDIRKSMAQGNYKAALGHLAKIDVAKIEREFIKQEYDFAKAYSLGEMAMTEGGDKAAAAKELLDFAKKNQNSYHWYKATELLGDVAAAAGNYADAEKYYGAVSNEKVGDVRIRLQGSVSLGRVLAAQGKHPEALAKFDEVVSDSTNTPDVQAIKQLAVVGRASALAETGKPDEAIKVLGDADGIIAKADPAKDKLLMARAYNAMGNVYLKQGKQKEALLSFLKTHLLFSDDPETHAEALYNLANLFSRSEKADKALEIRAMLNQKYAGSFWQQKTK